jgi:hypothetical protein
MPTDAPQRISYDKKNRRVEGGTYSITFAGRQANEYLTEMFFYEDANTRFYFLARRKVWTRSPGLPSAPRTGKTFDTETYTIVRLWGRESVCVHQRDDIPDDFKGIAKGNILEGMMLMEGYEQRPPKRVEIKAE